MYSALTKLNNGIYKVYRIIMMVLLAIMSIWVFLAIIFRWTQVSVPWIEEFTIYAFSWLTYFGSAVVLRDDGHIKVTAVTGKIKNQNVKKALAVVSNLIVLVFCCIVCYEAAKFVGVFYQRGATTTNVPAVKMYHIFSQIPLNYAIYVLFSFERIWGILNGQKEIG